MAIQDPTFSKIPISQRCISFTDTFQEKSGLHCRFSYAGTWELVNLFVGTKYFYENMAEKIAKYSRVKGQIDRTEQYASK